MPTVLSCLCSLWYQFIYVVLPLQDPTAYFRHESPCDLSGGSVSIATDYTKRQHVFRLKLASGGEYLFQCKDEVCITLSGVETL